MSLFGAVWTLASLKTIAESGAANATYYETVGWLGVMERDEGSPAPDQFPSIAGCVFPLYHVIAAAGEFRGGQVVLCESSEPLVVTGLVLRKGTRQRIVLANLSSEPQSLTIEGDGREYQQTRLEESSAPAAMQQPDTFRTASSTRLRVSPDTQIELSAYSLAFLDCG
jgi:hypothetical protein